MKWIDPKKIRIMIKKNKIIFHPLILEIGEVQISE